MGKIITVIIIVLIVIFVAFLAAREKDEPIDPALLEELKTTASDWVVNNAPTYLYDGSELTFKSAEQIAEESYKLTFEFTSAAAGYGDRTDEMVAQVITEHEIEIIVEQGQVISAITDGVYDEIAGEMIAETLPETMEIKLYFVRVEEIVEVERSVPYTVAVARAALEGLVEGPLDHEEADGLSTAIPEGTELQDIIIENGIATADFNQKLQEGVAGSAWVTTIRDQIEQTLLQFDTVDEVVITIDGQSEDILQP